MATMAASSTNMVEARDEMGAELALGFAHATQFYSAGRATLVDQFSKAELLAWDGSQERALASDADGIDLPDCPELDEAA